ncbi:MAG: hypothetical protein M3083_10320 [Actinomycetota bacterium]|nr:hypothetical protein [Actinomycetota bacterium]
MTAIGSNNINAPMVYCSGWPKGMLNVDHAANATLTVSVGTAKDGCPIAGGLAGGANQIYQVNMNLGPSPAFPTTLANGAWSLDTVNGDCMGTTTKRGANTQWPNMAGTKTLTGNHQQMWTVTYTANSAAAIHAAGICIGETSNSQTYAIEAPIVFI